MLKLVQPEKRYLKSYMDAYDEYEAHGITAYHFDDARSCDIFEKYENYRLARNLKPNRVGSDYYWLVDEEKEYFIGEISVRHYLTDALRLKGGHIGYGIRFAQWNKGYGTLMLKLALEKAKQRGLTRVLITCDDDNAASARVMEHNGFQMEDKVEIREESGSILIRRYWKTL